VLVGGAIVVYYDSTIIVLLVVLLVRIFYYIVWLSASVIRGCIMHQTPDILVQILLLHSYPHPRGKYFRWCFKDYWLPLLLSLLLCI